jgi:hypothetical protein
VEPEHIVVDANRVELDQALDRAENIKHGRASVRKMSDKFILISKILIFFSDLQFCQRAHPFCGTLSEQTSYLWT